MKIQWIGHSCFRLTESTGTVIVTDPFGEVGYEQPRLRADAVTSSHDHYDHNNFKMIEGNPQIFNRHGIYDFRGVKITGIRSSHDDENGKKRGSNIIFKFRMDGLDICHLGDIGHEVTPKLLDLLLPVNVLMVPVGGVYTIDAEQAKEYVDALMPDIVLPMHYKTKSLTLDIDRLDSFLRLFEDEEIEEPGSDTLELDRDDMDNESTKVVVLSRMKN